MATASLQTKKMEKGGKGPQKPFLPLSIVCLSQFRNSLLQKGKLRILKTSGSLEVAFNKSRHSGAPGWLHSYDWTLDFGLGYHLGVVRLSGVLGSVLGIDPVWDSLSVTPSAPPPPNKGK